MKRLISSLTLLLLQLNAAEITYTVKETTPLLPKKLVFTRKKNNYLQHELDSSISYNILHVFPKEIGSIIVKKFFGLLGYGNEDAKKKILNYQKKSLGNSLQCFYKVRLYELFKSSSIGKRITFDRAYFMDLDGDALEKLFNIEARAENTFFGGKLLFNPAHHDGIIVPKEACDEFQHILDTQGLVINAAKDIRPGHLPMYVVGSSIPGVVTMIAALETHSVGCIGASPWWWSSLGLWGIWAALPVGISCYMWYRGGFHEIKSIAQKKDPYFWQEVAPMDTNQ